MKVYDVLVFLREEILDRKILKNSIEVKNFYTDSRLVKKDTGFIASFGSEFDGHHFIGEAIQNGACLILYEDPNFAFEGEEVSRILVRNSRLCEAKISAFQTGFPSQNLLICGVTGTNGKTSVTYFLQYLLEQILGLCGRIGTIDIFNGKQSFPSSLTTPSASILHSSLEDMLENGCKSVVLEVSSHSLIQQRVSQIDFDILLFTNLGKDHLEYHGSMKSYFEAKKMFFEQAVSFSKKKSIGVVNIDDAYGRKLYAEFSSKMLIYTYGISQEADFQILNLENRGMDGMRFDCGYRKEGFIINTPIMGLFNAYNLTATLAVGKILGLDMKKVQTVLSQKISVPGRMELVSKENSVSIFVDYAHTKEALKAVLLELIEMKKNRLLVIFGCGGERDRGKRRKMAEIVSHYADISFITSDNPRSENIQQIFKDMQKGLSGNFSFFPNRLDAIFSAIQMSEINDIICLFGKGHENFQEFEGGRREEFSDAEVVKKVLKDVRRS